MWGLGTEVAPICDGPIPNGLGGSMFRRKINLLACVLLALAFPIARYAQTSADDRLKRVEDAVASAQGSADNAWMLVCCALVLLMTGPGLALFYGGLVNRKNVLATMMQSFTLMR